MKKSVTLAELMIAMTLLAVIVLSAGAFNLASEGFLRSSDRKAKVLNELSYVTDHLHRFILLATGDANDQGIIAPGTTTLTLRVDVSPVTFQPQNTPTYADDIWVRYRTSGNEIQFCPNFNTGAGTCSASWETLTNRFIDTTGGFFRFLLIPASGTVAVPFLAMVYDPSTYDSLNPDERNNPLATMISSVGQTLTFHSLNHSW